MSRSRARSLLWIPPLILIIWVAGWIACGEYRHRLRQQSMHGESVVLDEGSLAALLVTPEVFRASPRPQAQGPWRAAYDYHPGPRGVYETWMLEYPTTASDEDLVAASDEFARSRGYEPRSTRLATGYWTRTDDSGEWSFTVGIYDQGSQRLAAIAHGVERKNEDWYERIRRWVVPGSER